MRNEFGQPNWATLVALWTSIAERPENDARGSLRTFIDGVQAALGAPRSSVIVAGRYGTDKDDSMEGWKVIDLIYGSNMPREIIEAIEEYSSVRNNLLNDPVTIRMVNGTGLRAYRLADMIDDDDGDSVPSAKHVANLGIHDRLLAVLPVSDWAGVYLAFDRLPGDERFSDKDVQFVRNALEGLTWLGRNIALCYGLISERGPFYPRERETLSHLLDGLSEKQIAAKMGLTKSSTHQYVVSIYRKLGVRSRGELTALWIHRGERSAES